MMVFLLVSLYTDLRRVPSNKTHPDFSRARRPPRGPSLWASDFPVSEAMEIKKADGVYRTPILQDRIPEPELPTSQDTSALASAHWDGRLCCRLAIDIGGSDQRLGVGSQI